MSTQSLSRNATRAAAYAGGVSAMSAGIYGLLLAESLLARKKIGMTCERPPSADGLFGADMAGRPVSIIMLGDSAAVGYGMSSADDTPPGMVGWGLAHVLDRPVQVTTFAEVGARTADLTAQIDKGLIGEPDIALIIVGANDVTHRILPAESARQLSQAVHRLREAGCEVVVGTCPDLGTVQPLPQPLRFIARVWSRRLARRQALATLHAGGRVVSLADLLGESFATNVDIMFGADRFHPSRTGYANMISMVIPALAGAIRDEQIAAVYGDQFATGGPGATDDDADRLSISDAAQEASQHGGTEIVGRGRWAVIKRRRKR